MFIPVENNIFKIIFSFQISQDKQDIRETMNTAKIHLHLTVI